MIGSGIEKIIDNSKETTTLELLIDKQAQELKEYEKKEVLKSSLVQVKPSFWERIGDAFRLCWWLFLIGLGVWELIKWRFKKFRKKV